ncbi:hypothetical protein OIU74_008041 [Salix koriyanagi]|uniref:Uncharacterized protein n=1 Tax=Salix koriyanagi TaxID=2511006 RepID=A0A9Q0Z6Z2_9ROSI|nr:hypothetical protein OIU74_008041 [Salix koriyanagi]
MDKGFLTFPCNALDEKVNSRAIIDLIEAGETRRTSKTSKINTKPADFKKFYKHTELVSKTERFFSSHGILQVYSFRSGFIGFENDIILNSSSIYSFNHKLL